MVSYVPFNPNVLFADWRVDDIRKFIDHIAGVKGMSQNLNKDQLIYTAYKLSMQCASEVEKIRRTIIRRSQRSTKSKSSSSHNSDRSGPSPPSRAPRKSPTPQHSNVGKRVRTQNVRLNDFYTYR